MCIDKLNILESKNTELDRKYSKAISVISNLETENEDMKNEILLLREYKTNSQNQEKKMSAEYENILNEYKDQVRRLKQELSRFSDR